jgi:hypothetical protein
LVGLPIHPRAPQHTAAHNPDHAGAGPGHALQEPSAIHPVVARIVCDALVHLVLLWENLPDFTHAPINTEQAGAIFPRCRNLFFSGERGNILPPPLVWNTNGQVEQPEEAATVERSVAQSQPARAV